MSSLYIDRKGIALEIEHGALVFRENGERVGTVPISPLSRFFRDCAGRVNQRMAAAAAEVYLVVSGIPVRIKGAA